MRFYYHLSTFIAIYIIAFGAVSQQMGMSAATGLAVGQVQPIRFGVQFEWDANWLQDKIDNVSGYWDVSYYRFPIEKQFEVLACAGVFRWQPAYAWHQLYPYLDIGIGLSQVSHREYKGRKLGSYFQFEDRLGFGVTFYTPIKFDISYRLVHFSNAYLGGHNAGINLQLFVVGFWL